MGSRTLSFWGSHETGVLSDGRIRLPGRVVELFRASGGRVLMVGPLPERKALAAWPEIYWPSWAESLKQEYPGTDPQDVECVHLAGFREVSVGSQGRILIPKELRNRAGIKITENVVILGMGTHLEIWGPDRYDELTAKCGRKV